MPFKLIKTVLLAGPGFVLATAIVAPIGLLAADILRVSRHINAHALA